MKTIKIIAVLIFASVDLFAQQQLTRPTAQLTFRVITDEGMPVKGIEVAVATFHHWQSGEGFGRDISETFTGITNDDGFVTISAESLRGEFNYGLSPKVGFYRGGGGVYKYVESKNGKWQPHNPVLQVVVKPVINPIPMYGKKVGVLGDCSIPVVGKPIGFDLMAGDWVSPYGKGVVADLVFLLTETIQYVNVQKPFELVLTVSFSNKGDGIHPVTAPLNEGSELRLPRYAPEMGYQPQLIKKIGRPKEGEPLNTGISEDRSYFVRVRSSFDKNGNITTALYGKIIGDIQFWGNRKMRFSYCLNPNQSDRNMEFDPNQNLFGDMPFNCRISTP